MKLEFTLHCLLGFCSQFIIFNAGLKTNTTVTMDTSDHKKTNSVPLDQLIKHSDKSTLHQVGNTNNHVDNLNRTGSFTYSDIVLYNASTDNDTPVYIPNVTMVTEPALSIHLLNKTHIIDHHHTDVHSKWKNKFPNYRLLYNTMQEQKKERKRQTEFYAWIFGGTMLVLATVSTAVSCVVFCFCGDEKWRRPKRLKVDDGGEYHRVENVYPIHDDKEEGGHPGDSVTVI